MTKIDGIAKLTILKEIKRLEAKGHIVHWITVDVVCTILWYGKMYGGFYWEKDSLSPTCHSTSYSGKDHTTIMKYKTGVGWDLNDRKHWVGTLEEFKRL